MLVWLTQRPNTELPASWRQPLSLHRRIIQVIFITSLLFHTQLLWLFCGFSKNHMYRKVLYMGLVMVAFGKPPNPVSLSSSSHGYPHSSGIQSYLMKVWITSLDFAWCERPLVPQKHFFLFSPRKISGPPSDGAFKALPQPSITGQGCAGCFCNDKTSVSISSNV